MKTSVVINDSSCKINFSKMRHCQNSLSLKESLADVKPFEVSDNVRSGKNKIIVEAKRSNADVQEG